MVSFIYNNIEDLLNSQKILIDLAKHFIEQCDQVPLSLRSLYYECLTAVILRGELELNLMGYDQESSIPLMESTSKAILKKNQKLGSFNPDMKNMKQKIKVATSYQTFLYQTLEKVLNTLNQKGLIDKEKIFVEIFCAVAYFRIPEFRNKLLACVDSAHNEGVELTELRGADWLLDTRTSSIKPNNQLTPLFDWDRNFYIYLKVLR